MRHLDLFAGIGGFSKAVEWLGGETVAFVEWEEWNRRVLAKHWPGAKFFGDIKAVTDDDLRLLGHIDLITGGYPCQPFSLAGQRRGAEDDRHLWPEIRRVIDTLRPRFVLAENVAGHISMGLDTVLADLEADGYTAGAVVVPAGAVNALHRRDRVWIMGHANENDDRSGRGEHQRERQGVHVERFGLRHEPRRTGAVQGMADTTSAGQSPLDSERAQSGATRKAGATHARSGNAAPAVAYAGDDGPQAELQPVGHRPEHAATGNGDSSPFRQAGDGKAPRPVDVGAHGLPPGPLRRPSARSAWDNPDLIRAMWADGSWEADLPRVVTDEPERRQKLMAAGNAIVPLVAYEILRVMFQEDAV